MDASSTVKSLIDSNRVVVFGKSNCPHTRDAKRVIESAGLHPGDSGSDSGSSGGVKFVDMDREADGAAMQEALAFTGDTTVPRVFINGRFCGGGDDMLELQRSGRLEGLLQGSGGASKSGSSSS